MKLIIILGIILVIVIVILAVVIGMYNNFIRLRNDVDEAYSTMDVYLKKRFDLIPNLVETVKGYATHEKETLTAVITARSNISKASSNAERMQSESELSKLLSHLFAVAEAYPELKANQGFLNLQNQLEGLEEDIANSRKYYNATVKEYNTTIEMFPASIFANMFSFTKRDMYEVDSENERKNVQVSF